MEERTEERETAGDPGRRNLSYHHGKVELDGKTGGTKRRLQNTEGCYETGWTNKFKLSKNFCVSIRSRRITRKVGFHYDGRRCEQSRVVNCPFSQRNTVKN